MSLGQTLLLVFFATVLRLAFFLQDDSTTNVNGGGGASSIRAILESRTELISPLTSLRAIDEGFFFFSQGKSPYAGSAFHQSPLLLFIGLLSTPLRCGLWILLDVLIALMLGSISNKFAKENPKFGWKEGSRIWPSALYLFNPLAVASCLAFSTGVISNFFVVLALYTAYQASPSQRNFSFFTLGSLSMISASISTCLDVYPVMYLAPLLYILSREGESTRSSSVRSNGFIFVSLFVLSLSSLLWISHLLMNKSWEFVLGSYGFAYQVGDLKQNLGLFWYFFSEVFGEFRSIFLFIFHLHPFCYVGPLGSHFGKRYPLYYLWVLMAIVAVFKAYPTASDIVLYCSLLPSLSLLVGEIPFAVVAVGVYLHCVALAPILWYGWIVKGSGNSNYYYAMTLVLNVVQQYLIIRTITNVMKLLQQENQKKEEEKEKLLSRVNKGQ